MSKSITYTVAVNEGGTFWHLNGKRHREDGPACEYANGDKIWYINGNVHREDGPACEYVCGSKAWYLDDEPLSEQQFNKRTNPAEELTMAQIEQLLGKRIKIVK